MAYLGRWTLAVLLCCSAFADLRAQQPEVNPDAKVLQDYQERIKKYIEIHKKADVPKMKETKDPAEIKQAQEALAAAVRPGDVVLTMGAGDITRTGPELLQRLTVTS